MALVKCPQCGSEINEQSANCPSCGLQFKTKTVVPERPEKTPTLDAIIEGKEIRFKRAKILARVGLLIFFFGWLPVVREWIPHHLELTFFTISIIGLVTSGIGLILVIYLRLFDNWN